jgi:hypothetical protein
MQTMSALFSLQFVDIRREGGFRVYRSYLDQNMHQTQKSDFRKGFRLENQDV